MAGSEPQALPPLLQYCLKTALLPALESPATVTFQPEGLAVVSLTEKLFICAVVVCAWPLRAMVPSEGSAGAVSKVKFWPTVRVATPVRVWFGDVVVLVAVRYLK